jgi:hypothetical protein
MGAAPFKFAHLSDAGAATGTRVVAHVHTRFGRQGKARACGRQGKRQAQGKY